MIEEDYVSYETAQLLKSKGFDELCYACYEYFRSGVTMYSGWLFEYKGEPVHNTNDRVKCPTLQMAMKWLREIYHIHTEICLYKTNKDDIEYKLAFQTQHLPIDQRYDDEEMKYIRDLFAGFPYNSINLD